MGKPLRFFTTMAAMLCFCLLVGGAWAQQPAGDLDQGKNETPAAFVDPVQWVNGNLNDNQAHYLEGMSIPYRLVLTNLSIGSHTVNIEWDTRDQSKAAIDYITHFQRLEPHSQFLPAHSAEIVDPLLGLGLGSPPLSTFPIPTPSTNGTLVAGQPATSFNALPAGERVMTIYNGTITSMPYANEDPLGGMSAKTRLTINFTASASTVVLAWGGHIASNEDWDGGAHPGGSPYHTRFIDLDGKGGNQDRSLKSGAVFTCEVSGASPVCAGTTNTYTVTTNVGNPSFSWSFTSNTSGASFVGSTTGSSVQVNSGNTGGSFTLEVQITSANGGVKCDLTVTVDAVAFTTSKTDVTCNGANNGTITITTTSGTPPFMFSKDNGATFQASNVFTGLAPGTYNLVVKDANNCQATGQVTITQPPLLTANAVATNALCFGGNGSVNLTVVGGTPPYSFLWSNGATTEDLAAVPAGNYSVTVTDANGCTANANATVNEPSAVALSLSKTDITCKGANDGKITATFSGGTGAFMCKIDGGAF
ncbi:SprB repeat-containing protein, partial [candidate division KSB1 bacterium]|nr:SprB repeat-containing protein [candidate division KSB1 bacterium]